MPPAAQSVSQSLRNTGQDILAYLGNFLPFVASWRSRRTNYYFDRAEKFFAAGHLPEAIADLNKVLEWSTNKGEAYDALGFVYYELGDRDNAKDNLMQAVLDDYKHGVTSTLRTLKYLGFIFHQERNFTEAMYYYLKALEVPDGRSDETVLTNLSAVFYDLGQYEESLKYSRQAEVINADSPAILENIGRAAYALGDLHTAAQSLERAVHLSPGDAELTRLLALCYRAQGDTARAIETLRAVRDSNNPEVFFDLSVALEEQGQHAEGAQAATQAAEHFKLAEQPDREAEAYWQLGWCIYKQGDLQRSADASRKAVELNPNLFAAQFNLGLVLLLMGDQEGARQHYEAGLNAVREPSDIKVYAISDLKAAAKAHDDVPGLQPILKTLQAKHTSMSKALAGPDKSPSLSK